MRLALPLWGWKFESIILKSSELLLQGYIISSSSFLTMVAMYLLFNLKGLLYIFCTNLICTFIMQITVARNIKLIMSLRKLFRGCSCGGELARLGGLARLGEISPSLRNSYKNIMCSYEKWPSPPRWDLTWFCRDPT